MSNYSIKDSEGKTAWQYFPFRECEEVAKTFEYGAKKYNKPFLYRSTEAQDTLDTKDWIAAIMRHIVEIDKGNQYDKETGCLHLAHIAANALMAMSNKKGEI